MSYHHKPKFIIQKYYFKLRGPQETLQLNPHLTDEVILRHIRVLGTRSADEPAFNSQSGIRECFCVSLQQIVSVLGACLVSGKSFAKKYALAEL